MNVILRSVFAAVAITVFAFSNAHAQVNSWTKPTSGYWEELFWSLGVRPASGHSIMFTNEGWKALAIGASTVANFPSTMQITRLTVLSPTNSYNTLLLNFAGVQTPLRIAENFYLGSNSVLLSLSSGLKVGNEFRVDGTVNHSDFSEVAARILYAGYTNNPGVYNLSNGVLTVSNLMFVGYGAPATFTQHGGSNISAQIRFRAGGQYALRGGDVAVGTIVVGDRSTGSFEQSSGRVRATDGIFIGGASSQVDGLSAVGSGRYTLSSGAIETPILVVGRPRHRFDIGGDGVFDQAGGSVSADALSVGANRALGMYNLTGGGLVTSNSAVTPGGEFVQSRGTHLIDGDLRLWGEYERAYEPIYATYRLTNGVLRARSLGIFISDFWQWNGTNDIAGDLLLDREFGGVAHSSYHLGGGRLNTYNTTVMPTHNGGFSQGGGTHSIIGTLNLPGTAGPFSLPGSSFVFYTLSGGQLIVRDIRVSTHSIFRHAGGTISNSGSLTLAGGHWESAPGAHQLGVLSLESGPTNSSLTLSDSATTLRFASSAASPWASDARLIIQNWRGSLNGGGLHRVIFGTTSTGLNAQQLAKIRFRNPVGLPAGDYVARILSTGEIVPIPRPPVSYTRNGSQLTLQWPAGWTLQTATNISGPFSDVNASTSYSTSTGSGAQRYFRLRQ